jgi:hypothetical protein
MINWSLYTLQITSCWRHDFEIALIRKLTEITGENKSKTAHWGEGEVAKICSRS